MKQLLTVALFLLCIGCGKEHLQPDGLHINQMYTLRSGNLITLIADTIVNTTWDLKGMVLNGESGGKVHGTGTITNGILDFGITQVSFDTSVNFTNIKTWNGWWSTAWYGISPTITDNWWIIQKSANICSANRLVCKTPGRGQYNYSKTLDFSYKPTTTYQQYYIDFEGDASVWDNGTGTTFHYTGMQGPGLNAQLNKGSVFRNFALTGLWKSPAGVDSVYYRITEANYKDASGYNLPDWYAGFAIDYYYDGYSRSGSTGITVENVTVGGFTELFSFSENAYTQNDETHSFNHIHLLDGKYGFVNHQAQEKGTIIQDVKSWGSIYNIVNIGWKGAAGAGYYTFDGANVAGRCISPINISVAHWFPSTFSNWFCESVDNVGNFSSASTHVKVENCEFDLNTSYNKHRNVVYSNSTAIEFNNCLIQYYDGQSSNVYWHGYATFDANCSFGLGHLIAQ